MHIYIKGLKNIINNNKIFSRGKIQDIFLNKYPHQNKTVQINEQKYSFDIMQ